MYWRISPRKQSFPLLLEWWREQSNRPVWPGIATARIQSSEDPGRPASEITNQIDLARKIGRGPQGHIHWSAKSIVTNRGGIATKLAGSYTQAAAVPAMPWINNNSPDAPGVSAQANGDGTLVRWTPEKGTAKIAIQTRIDGNWRTAKITSAGSGQTTVPRADAIAVTALDRFGNASSPKVLGLR